MTDFRNEIHTAFLNNEPISRDKFLAWVAAAADLPTLAKLYHLKGQHYYRIQPELGDDASCALIQRYFLECIRQDVKDHEEILDRWEAARALQAWICQLNEMGDASKFIQNVARAVTDLFLISGKEVRDAIEMGFLEHALETAALRPYFEHWALDDRLRDAWNNALEWGKAHPDFMWGMIKKIQKLSE